MLPAVLTGVRLSIGIAWLVIVAAEMLTGGLGIGFWIWNEWNNLNVENIHHRHRHYWRGRVAAGAGADADRPSL